LKLARVPRSLAATRRGFTFYVADPVSSIETRSRPTLARRYPSRLYLLCRWSRQLRWNSLAPHARSLLPSQL